MSPSQNIPNVMENELFNLQKKIMDLESKLSYGDPMGHERENEEQVNGGSGESGDIRRPPQSLLYSENRPENIVKSTQRGPI